MSFMGTQRGGCLFIIVGAVTVAGAVNREFSGLKYAIICLCGPAAKARATNVSLRQLLVTNVAKIDVEMATAALQQAPNTPPLDVAIAATDCTAPSFSSHHEAAWRRPRREARAPCGIIKPKRKRMTA